MKGFMWGVAAALAASTCGCGSAPKGAETKTALEKPVPVVTVTPVVEQKLRRELRLPGEITAYQDVALWPKVQGFVESVTVDRGSAVKRGQLLVRMTAPELAAQRSEADAKARAAAAQRGEAEARLLAVRAQRAEAEAKQASDEATYKRLKAASATPGVVAGNDVEIAQRTAEASRARVLLYQENERGAAAQIEALKETERASQSAARSVTDVESYLRVTAPFDGIVTERNVHPGSLVGPAAAGPNAPPMLRIQQVSTLRLTVAVPENNVSAIVSGADLRFTVPAFPGETFTGKVRRIARVLDGRTRTMPVELEVSNTSGRLAPGMYAEVVWPSGRPAPSLFVPPTAVATTTERTFVVRIRNGVAEWVDCKRGASMGGLVEVFGPLAAGDLVAVRGTDELRAGTRVETKTATSNP